MAIHAQKKYYPLLIPGNQTYTDTQGGKSLFRMRVSRTSPQGIRSCGATKQLASRH